MWLSGADVPEIEARPELRAQDRPIWRAFNHLSPSRSAGFAVGAVAIDKVEAYVRMFKPHYDIEERLEFFEQIAELDAHLLAFYSKDKPGAAAGVNRQPIQGEL